MTGRMHSLAFGVGGGVGFGVQNYFPGLSH